MTEQPSGPCRPGEGANGAGPGARVAGEVEAWLLSLAAPGSPRGAEALRIARALVEELAHPHRAAPAVHVVGTAGKGTVASALTQLVVASGRSVATHLSPHVHDIRERFQLDGAPAGDAALAAAFAELRAASEAVTGRVGRPPTFFAATAALSWIIGRNAGVDVFVTEAGVGGRHDATAVLDRSDTLTVITAIGLDHTDVLGDTVEAVAAEKAAVVRGRRTAILTPQPHPEAAAVVRSIADDAGVRLVEPEPTDGWKSDMVAAAELAHAHLVHDHGFAPVDHVTLTDPPGRVERREIAGRSVVLDGAHNPLKLAGLAEALHGDGAPRPSAALVALGAGKDVVASASALGALGCPIVVTAFGGGNTPASHPAAVVADALRGHGVEAVAIDDLGAAARRVVEMTAPDDRIVVTGSFLFLTDAAAALAACG